MTGLFLRLGAVSLLGLLGAAALQAQSIYGGLRGAVTDSGGGAVAGVKISLVNEGTAESRVTLTNTTGEYNFASVIPGAYTVIAENPGFKRFERKGVAVATQQFLTVDVGLEVGQVTESVMVTEEVPLIDTATASQGQVIDRQKLVDLPNLGRNPYMFSKLAPNVVQVGNPAYMRMQDQSGSSQISIAGGPVRGNNYLIDGVPITDMANRAIIIASLEAVEEMKVQSNTYDAEIGRSGGGMFNGYLKSGTNLYHGSLFGYMRQTGWLANNYFSNRAGRSITPQPFRNYGGSFGGAVWVPKVYNGKNRTFFWATFEGYRDTQANTGEFATPTMRERAGDFSQSKTRTGATHVMYDPLNTAADGARTPFAGNIIPSTRIDPVGRAMAATYMQPQRDARFFGDTNLTGLASLASKADQKTLKFDHRFTDWWSASLSYMRYNSIEPGNTWFPTISSPDQWRLDRRVDATALNNTITVNPTTVLAVRYGFNRFPNYGFQASQGFNPATLGFSNTFVRDIASLTFPNVTMETFHNFGTNNNFNVVPYSRNLVGSLSKFVGRHSIKLGADYRRISLAGIDNGNSSGAFTFNDVFTRETHLRATAGTGSDLAGMLLGTISSGSGFLSTRLNQYTNYTSMFVHDDFRLTSRITLNLGLRWERETGLAEVNDLLISGFNRDALNPISTAAGVPARGAVYFAGVNGAPRTVGNPNLNKLSPRLGIAFTLDPKTTVRAGYGIFWAPQVALTTPYLSEGVTASTPIVGSFDGNRTPNPGISLSNPFPSGLIRPAGNTRGEATGIGNSMTIFDPAARSTMVQQFSIDVQRELPGKIAMSVAYVGSRTRNLQLGTANININQLEPRHFGLGSSLTQQVANPFFGNGGTGAIGAATYSRAQSLRPFPIFGDLNYTLSDRNRARYDSMVVRAQKRFSEGLSFLAAWTYSRNLDASSGGPGNFLNAGNVGPQNVYDMDAEYSLANIHSPHRLSLTASYDLPFGKGKALLGSAPKALNHVVGGWSVHAVSIMQTGYPLQIRQNSNNNSAAFAASQRPNATGVTPATEGRLQDRIDGYINPAAFSQAPAFTFGNVSRSIGYRGPGQINWDLSVFKTVAITESLKAQFRAEALNAMNTPWFRAPNTAFGNAAFGRITEQGNFARMIQLGMRIYF